MGEIIDWDKKKRVYEKQIKKLERQVKRLEEENIVLGRINEQYSNMRDLFEEEKDKAKERAEKSDRAKSDFLANMSHEIRTPINAIIGLNEMIMWESKNKNIKEYAMNIKSASNNLLVLINDILDFSKIESGKMEIIENNYHLSSLLNDVVNMIGIKAKQKNLEFKIDVQEDLYECLYGDDVRIRQILINLLTNAVKYTPEGNIKLVVSKKMDNDDGIVLCFAIADTGIGIKDDEKHKLFQNFERLDLKKNRHIEGTGLGLSIVCNLVDLMNGIISFESEYGKGSTFTVLLPQKVISHDVMGNYIERYKNFIAQQEEYHDTFTAPEAKILIVDDNLTNLYVIKKRLERIKAQITCLTNGRECLDAMCRERFDLILLDHMMPEMDGIEVLKASKTLEGNKCTDTPIVVLTANAIVGAKEMYLAEGFTDYLSKPIDGKTLEKALQTYIPAEKINFANGAVANDVSIKDIKDMVEEKAVVKEYDFLNIESGLEFAGDDEEMYRDFLENFYEQSQDNITKACGCYALYEWKDYTIHVHGLKSSSLSVGCNSFSEIAKSLEEAGKQIQVGNDPDKWIKYINENHVKMMKAYENTIKEIRDYLDN